MSSYEQQMNFYDNSQMPNFGNFNNNSMHNKYNNANFSNNFIGNSGGHPNSTFNDKYNCNHNQQHSNCGVVTILRAPGIQKLFT